MFETVIIMTIVFLLFLNVHVDKDIKPCCSFVTLCRVHELLWPHPKRLSAGHLGHYIVCMCHYCIVHRVR